MSELCVNDRRHKYSADELARKLFRAGPNCSDGHVFFQIEFIGGFEFFNTRPYHNFETWSEGWRVIASDVVVENECLLCALEQMWVKLRRDSQ